MKRFRRRKVIGKGPLAIAHGGVRLSHEEGAARRCSDLICAVDAAPAFFRAGLRRAPRGLKAATSRAHFQDLPLT